MLLNRNVDRMTLADIIDARAVLPAVKAQNKKQVLQELSQAIASLVAVDHRVVYETLHRREKLGSTGLGQGIAIPHGRLPNINRVYGLFARLATPVDFESIDGQPVEPPHQRRRQTSLFRGEMIVGGRCAWLGTRSGNRGCDRGEAAAYP